MHVMADLETLDTHHTGVILSIGAVVFGLSTLGVGVGLLIPA